MKRQASVRNGELVDNRTRVSNWAMLREGDRLSLLFWYDQLKLRYQYAIRREYTPKPSWWKKKVIKRDIEMLFDDIDEEIYFEELFAKNVTGVESLKTKERARYQKSMEDLEETFAGYDKFTVEEEKQIKKMTEAAVKSMLKAEKETGQI